MKIRTEHLTTARTAIEMQHRIKIGYGVIVYDVQSKAWSIPGGLHTTHRPAAERAAQLIDLMFRGEIKGPRIVRGKHA